LLTTGVIKLADGWEHRSPSGAAMAAADVASYAGWNARRVGDDETANEVRRRPAMGAVMP
jgi:hypothetical protein